MVTMVPSRAAGPKQFLAPGATMRSVPALEASLGGFGFYTLDYVISTWRHVMTEPAGGRRALGSTTKRSYRGQILHCDIQFV
jgi:hypothetical protein